MINNGNLDEALEVFKMNIELFPKSTNVYDSQGKAYLYIGNTEKAIESYSKIIQIDSKNTNGQRIIKNIKEEYKKRHDDKLQKFHLAAKTGNILGLKSWLEINPGFLNQKSDDGNTALYLAVYGVQIETVKYLISKGADINMRNIMRQSAYNLAGECNFKKINNYLISIDTDIRSQEFPSLTSKYLGQKEPGITPEIFAKGIVSNHRKVYGNIVFSPDFSEACWTPNEAYNAHQHGGLIISKYINGKWKAPKEKLFLDKDYSHRSPFYSLDGTKLYFQGYVKSNQGFDQKEKFYYVSKTKDGWSEPKLLDTIFNKFSNHWQFSFDKNNNFYFGGRLRNKENSGGIYLSMYVSFKNSEGLWSDPQDVGEILKMDSNQPRISPDGKYIFYVGNNGASYWLDEKINEKLKPKSLNN